MSALLDAVLDPVRAEDCRKSDELLPKPPATFQARSGRRRVFLSQADANAYDAGYASYPCGDIPAIHTPGSMGYFDHESRDFDRLSGSGE